MPLEKRRSSAAKVKWPFRQLVNMGATESRNERFYQCCGLGKAHLVEKMLESDKLYNTINVDWMSFETKSTPLLIASANGHDNVVDILLKNNANPNSTDSRDHTSLHHSAQRGYSEIIKKLMIAGCDVDAVDMQKWSPLMNACYWCQPDAVVVLLEAGACVSLNNNAGRAALHELCRSPVVGKESELAEIAMALIEAGAEIDGRPDTEEQLTPLMYAAYHNHLDVAVVLIESNCDLNAVDRQGWSALHWACDRNNPDVVQLLLDKGCLSSIRCMIGRTAVSRAKSSVVRDMFQNQEDFIDMVSSDDSDTDDDGGMDNMMLVSSDNMKPRLSSLGTSSETRWSDDSLASLLKNSLFSATHKLNDVGSVVGDVVTIGLSTTEANEFCGGAARYDEQQELLRRRQAQCTVAQQRGVQSKVDC